MRDDEITTGAKHITSLDFDLSAIPRQFADLEKLVTQQSKRLKEILDTSLKANLNIQGLGSGVADSAKKAQKQFVKGVTDMTEQLPQFNFVVSDKSYKDLELLKDSLRETLKRKGELSKIDLYTDNDDGMLKARVTTVTDQNEKIVETFKLVEERIGETKKGVDKYRKSWELASQTMTQNVSAQQKSLQKYNTDIDKVQSKISDIESSLTGRLNIGSNKYLKDQLGVYQQQLDAIRKRAEGEKQVTAEQQQQLAGLSTMLDRLRDASNVSKNSGINRLVDRTLWAAAFKIQNAVLNVARQMPEAYKETEMAIVEITRVMNEATLDTNKYMYELYNTAINYGRAIEDVTEVTLRFAQAGYNSADAMKLTQTTMLALNTAELETESATNSLIGIMQQWGYTADEYEGIIDRINITADNYAITSQDLVDAMLQSSAVAKSAGLNFEELIGALTTMKVASGQSGKAVGTAFRSILSLMQRATSLKGFEALGIDVYANKATGELLPMMEILENMSRVWKNGSAEMQDSFMDVADSIGLMSEEMATNADLYDEYTSYQEAFKEATNAANDSAKREQATLAANMQRRNYYIALMENFANIQDVVNNMQTADGYSMRENAKYMDTLEAKYTSFSTAVQEFAVTLMDSGLADLAKLVLDVATSFLNFLNQAKLTLPVVTALGGVLLNIANNYGLLKIQAEAAGTQMSLFGKASLVAKSALQAVNLETAAVTAGVSLMVSALIKVVAVMKDEYDYLHQAENIYEGRIEAINEESNAEQRRMALAEAYVKKLRENIDSQGKLLLSEQQATFIVSQLNENIDGLNLSYDANTGTLNMNTDAIMQNVQAMQERLQAEAQQDTLRAKYEEQSNLLRQILELQQQIDEAQADFETTGKSHPEIVGWTTEIETLQGKLDELQGDIDTFTESMTMAADEAPDGDEMAEAVDAATYRLREFTSTAETAADSVKEYIDSLKELEDIYVQLASGESLSAEQVLNLLDSYPELALAVRQTADGYYIEESALRAVIAAKYESAMADQAVLVAERAMKDTAWSTSAELHNLATRLSQAKSGAEMAAIATAFLNSEMAKSGQVSDNVLAAAQKLRILGSYLSGIKQGEIKGIGGNTSRSTSSGGGGGGRSIYQERIDELERYKKRIEDAAQAEIDALKRVQEERDRYRKLRDLEEDLERARSRSGVDARMDERDLLRQIAEQKEDWAIDDQIAAIERQRDAQIAAIDAQIAELRSKTSAYISDMGQYSTDTVASSTDFMADEYSGLFSGIVTAGEETSSRVADDAVKKAIERARAMRENFWAIFIDPVKTALAGLSFDTAQLPGMTLNPNGSRDVHIPGITKFDNRTSNSNVTFYQYSHSSSTLQDINDAVRRAMSRYGTSSR